MTVDSLRIECDVERARVAVVVARGCSAQAAPPDLSAALDSAIADAKSQGPRDSEAGPVRDMLRHGKYKPTGRGKPASEYLLNAALGDRFPRINNLVDINNLVSLRWLLPSSLVDLARANREHFIIRHGRAGESYVFNTAGQTIDLEDLLVLARLPEDEPCANPVKDALATKLDAQSTDVMAVIYAPLSARAGLAAAAEAFEEALRAWGGARHTAHGFLGR